MTISGNYDSLFVDNLGCYFKLAYNNSHVNYLNIRGLNQSKNELAHIDHLDLHLENASINGNNIKNLTNINLQNNSELTVKGLPDFSEIKKDETSKITFN